MTKRTFSLDRQLHALKPEAKHYDVRDAETKNLMARVAPRTAKGEFKRTFCLVIRFPGSANPQRHALGEYPEMSLKDARAKANDWRARIHKGEDPRKSGPTAKTDEAKKAAGAATIERALEDYIATKLAGQRRGDASEREIRSEILPHWKDEAVSEIAPADIILLVRAIRDRPAPYHAHNVFGHIKAFFRWALHEFDKTTRQNKYGLKNSPAASLTPGLLIGQKKPRKRMLSDLEVAALWRAGQKLGYPYGDFIRLKLIVGQRKSELAEARWREFHPDLVKMLRDRKADAPAIDWTKVDSALKLWTVPAERFKSDSDHLVPLSDDALAILETLPHFVGRGSSDFLFSTTNGSQPINGFAKDKRRLDALMLRGMQAKARRAGDDPSTVKLAPFVQHDLRRVVRTKLAALKVPDEIAETVIGHGKKGLQRVYDQHRYVDEMRDALDRWAMHLRTIVLPKPSNVVMLGMARA